MGSLECSVDSLYEHVADLRDLLHAHMDDLRRQIVELLSRVTTLENKVQSLSKYDD